MGENTDGERDCHWDFLDVVKQARSTYMDNSTEGIANKASRRSAKRDGEKALFEQRS